MANEAGSIPGFAATPHNEAVLQEILGMVGGQQGGGLGGLVQQFQQAGMSDLVGSWVSTGPNVPATPQHIQQGLGQAGVQAIAQKLGISPQVASTVLAQLLPLVIDKLTPQGQVPAQNELQQSLGGLGGLAGLAGLLGPR